MQRPGSVNLKVGGPYPVPMDWTPLLGLIGVVVGGGLTVLSSPWQDRRKQTHDQLVTSVAQESEDRLRAEQRRFDAYVDLTAAANRVCCSCRAWPPQPQG